MFRVSRILAFAGLYLVGTAHAATTYVGTWNNTTFGSSGAATFVVDLTSNAYSISADLDGNVFGGVDPPVAVLSGTLDPGSGNGSIELLDHPIFGDILGSISGGSIINVTMSPPADFIDEVTVFGTLSATQIALNYEVFFATPPGGSAIGTITANAVVVPLPPALALMLPALGLVARRKRFSSAT